MTSRTCTDCATPVSTNSHGRCRPCANRLPRSAERNARVGATQRKRLADNPEAKAALVKGSAARLAVWRASPEGRAVLLANLAAERAAGIKASADLRAAWCPTQYRAYNSELVRQGVGPARRKRLIAERQARDEAAEAARLASLTPFERQLDRVRKGARLVPTFRPVRAYPAYTLGGVSGGML